MIATTLKGTRSAIRKLIEENQYFDDPKGEIFTVWDDSIPEIEPFVDSPGYYNEAGEYIEYTPEERQKRREEHMAAVLEREMLIDARQKKLVRFPYNIKFRYGKVLLNTFVCIRSLKVTSKSTCLVNESFLLPSHCSTHCPYIFCLQNSD